MIKIERKNWITRNSDCLYFDDVDVEKQSKIIFKKTIERKNIPKILEDVHEIPELHRNDLMESLSALNEYISESLFCLQIISLSNKTIKLESELQKEEVPNILWHLTPLFNREIMVTLGSIFDTSSSPEENDHCLKTLMNKIVLITNNNKEVLKFKKEYFEPLYNYFNDYRVYINKIKHVRIWDPKTVQQQKLTLEKIYSILYYLDNLIFVWLKKLIDENYEMNHLSKEDTSIKNYKLSRDIDQIGANIDFIADKIRKLFENDVEIEP